MILRQRLTAMGWTGLVFFFLGPIAFIQSFFLGLFGVHVVIPTGIAETILLALLFISVPLLLLGREWVVIKE